MRAEAEEQYGKLKDILREMGGVVVGFSGGVDSTLVLRAAVEVLDDRALGVTITSPIHPGFEVEEARELAEGMGARHRVIELNPLEDPNVLGNPTDRCYHCKRAVFGTLLEVAEEEGLTVVVDGGNADDVGDYRPGVRAIAELGVRSPLKEAGLGKTAIREISKGLGLPTWDKPALACLATRIPYGEQLTHERLRRVEAAEDYLRGLGVGQIRVRDHGSVARIEVPEDEFDSVMSRHEVIAEELKRLGYQFVTLDLVGYRMGSMNVGVSEG